jgi:hypothetical protein
MHPTSNKMSPVTLMSTCRLSFVGRGIYAWSVNSTWAQNNAAMVGSWGNKTTYAQWPASSSSSGLSSIPDWNGPVRHVGGRVHKKLSHSQCMNVAINCCLWHGYVWQCYEDVQTQPSIERHAKVTRIDKILLSGC